MFQNNPILSLKTYTPDHNLDINLNNTIEASTISFNNNYTFNIDLGSPGHQDNAVWKLHGR